MTMTKTISHTAERLTELVRELNDQSKLKAWNELADDVKLFDPALAAALTANRPVLAKMSPLARGEQAATAEQTKMLYHLVLVLLDTNGLLQRHAAQVAQLVENWAGHFKGLIKAGREIENFAKFREAYGDEGDE